MSDFQKGKPAVMRRREHIGEKKPTRLVMGAINFGTAAIGFVPTRRARTVSWFCKGIRSPGKVPTTNHGRPFHEPLYSLSLPAL
jgi:hypothetical protein